MEKKDYVYKYICAFLLIALSIILLCGCSAVSAETPGQDESQTMEATSDDKGDSAFLSEDSEAVTRKSYVYTTENCIYPMSQAVTGDGVECQVLQCQVTTEFGDRNMDNLNYFYDDGGIDDEGNLTKDSRYIFLTIQYTNTTDSEIEICRGGKGIYFLDAHYIVADYDCDPVYIDSENSEKTANESYFYDLKPGESITCEVGWVINKAVINAYDSIYFVAQQVDCETDFGGATDPNAVYIKLEY
jgi:hypothetical protein